MEKVDIYEDSRGLFMVITEIGGVAGDKFITVKMSEVFCAENNYEVRTVPPIR